MIRSVTTLAVALPHEMPALRTYQILKTSPPMPEGRNWLKNEPMTTKRQRSMNLQAPPRCRRTIRHRTAVRAVCAKSAAAHIPIHHALTARICSRTPSTPTRRRTTYSRPAVMVIFRTSDRTARLWCTRLRPELPDVDHRLSTQVERLECLVRGTKDEHVAFPDDLFRGRQLRIRLHVRVCR